MLTMRTTILIAVSLCACSFEPVGVNTEPPADSPPKQYGQGDAPLVSPCHLDATSARPVLAGSTSGEAFVVRADGTKVTLMASGGAQTWMSAPLSRGAYIAVTTTAIEGGRYVSRLTLFDAGGSTLASAVAGGGYLSELGVVAATSSGGLLLLSADGSQHVEPGLSVAADFGPGGLLPVWRGTGETRELALLDVGTREVTALKTPLAGWSAPIWAEDMLVYLGESNGMLSLVRRRGAVELVTPIIGAAENQRLEVEQVAAGSAVLVAGSWVQIRSRLDLETGVLTPLDVTLPAGFLFAGRRSATLADDGALVAALQKDGAAGLFRSVDGKSWTPMGEQVEGATYVQFAGRHGAWVMSAAGSLGWASAKALGMLPAMGRSVELPSLATGVPEVEALSEDGRCVAVWSGTEAEGFTLTSVDLVRNTSRVLTTAKVRPTSASWLR